MGTMLSCGNAETAIFVPEMHIANQEHFIKNFKTPKLYVDIHNLFPNFQSVEFLRSNYEEKFLILST